MFLGYNNMHKGYKCLNKSTGQVYISWDVVFDEHNFPFSTDKDLSSNSQISHTLPIHLPTPPVICPSSSNSLLLGNDQLENRNTSPCTLTLVLQTICSKGNNQAHHFLHKFLEKLPLIFSKTQFKKVI